MLPFFLLLLIWFLAVLISPPDGGICDASCLLAEPGLRVSNGAARSSDWSEAYSVVVDSPVAGLSTSLEVWRHLGVSFTELLDFTLTRSCVAHGVDEVYRRELRGG